MNYFERSVIETSLVITIQETSVESKYSELLIGKSNHLVTTPSPVDYELSTAIQL